MQKDVIYIDVEDDITAIIDKVKKANEKVVALVPPKRVGVLQSAVNLRLLARTAESSRKHLVLITSNAALSGLAASARIPVAKNLQSKPEIAQLPTKKTDDDDDLIQEDESAATPVSGMVPASTIEGIDINNDVPPTSKTSSPRKATSAKKGIKVPDFGTFRKKAFLFGGLGVLLIIFLIWAIWFAPRATVVISAKTSDQDLSTQVTLGSAIDTDSEQAHIKSVQQQEKVSQTVEFDGTGEKDVGEKSKGTVRFTTDSYSALIQGVTISAGTPLTANNGKVFYTDRTVQLSISAGNSDSTGVTAAESGDDYNGASGAVSGGPSSVNASLTGATAGGTEKIVKIVLQADVEKAKQQLADQNTNEVKKKLEEKFGDNVTLIDSSFKSSGGNPQSSPAIGQEVSGKAKLTQEMTYTMTGIEKSQLDTYLNSTFKEMLTNDAEQKIYDNGASTVKFSDFTQKDGDQAGVALITATAQVGPRIDDSDIKEQVKGKRYGEIQGDLKAIDGVSDVEVKLSPFWVQGVPGDINKITIEFKLLKNNG